MSATTADVVYCAGSASPLARNSAMQRCAAMAIVCSSAISSKASRGARAAQRNGADLPVPRGSISTMSRLRRTPPSAPARGASASDDCPGPPGSMISGSGCGESVAAGSTTTAIARVRPAGRPRSSGTSTLPHCAAVASFGTRHSVSAICRTGALLPHAATRIRQAAKRRGAGDRPDACRCAPGGVGPMRHARILAEQGRAITRVDTHDRASYTAASPHATHRHAASARTGHRHRLARSPDVHRLSVPRHAARRAASRCPARHRRRRATTK